VLNSWVTLFPRMVSLWILAKCRRSWIGSHTSRYVQPAIFLGLAGYYHRFILDFSKIAKPMTELLKKCVKFIWSEECYKAFHTLREYLTSAPVLTQLDM
jgi:hypothetical protein